MCGVGIFSKRLHHAVVRFVTDDGVDRYALERILQERYAVSINIPDYTRTNAIHNGEHAGRFSEFKNEELMALVSMLEEFPTRHALKSPGLKYLSQTFRRHRPSDALFIQRARRSCMAQVPATLNSWNLPLRKKDARLIFHPFNST